MLQGAAQGGVTGAAASLGAMAMSIGRPGGMDGPSAVRPGGVGRYPIHTSWTPVREAKFQELRHAALLEGQKRVKHPDIWDGRVQEAALGRPGGVAGRREPLGSFVTDMAPDQLPTDPTEAAVHDRWTDQMEKNFKTILASKLPEVHRGRVPDLTERALLSATHQLTGLEFDETQPFTPEDAWNETMTQTWAKAYNRPTSSWEIDWARISPHGHTGAVMPDDDDDDDDEFHEVMPYDDDDEFHDTFQRPMPPVPQAAVPGGLPVEPTQAVMSAEDIESERQARMGDDAAWLGSA